MLPLRYRATIATPVTIAALGPILRIYLCGRFWALAAPIKQEKDDRRDDENHQGDDDIHAQPEDMGGFIGTHSFDKEPAQRIAHDIEGKDSSVPQLPCLVRPQEE